MEVTALAAAGCSLLPLTTSVSSVSVTPSATFRYSPSCAPPSSVAIRCVLGQNSVALRSSNGAKLGLLGRNFPFSNRAAEGYAEGSASSCAAQAEKSAFVDVELEEEEEEDAESSWGAGEEEETPVAYGDVDLILASRVVDRKTQYLILWKDDHPDSWEPAGNIASDVVDEFEKPWWQAARKADADKLKELLEDEELQRDVNAIDENERNALFFAAGLGSEKCCRLLIEYGADVHWQDRDGFTALHIASGYVHVNSVKALVELGADPDLEDAKGRSALSLAQELLDRTPKANPLQFARRLALDQVVKALDEVMYETVEVEQVLDKRLGDTEQLEYLVKWSDNSENSWVPATDIGEDLIKDYEDGLEYGIVEQVLDKRETEGKVEYFVKWSDGQETWESEKNVGEEVVAEYNNSRNTQ
ncbi:unnamed protein product [Calypogeia fissa]